MRARSSWAAHSTFRLPWPARRTAGWPWPLAARRVPPSMQAAVAEQLRVTPDSLALRVDIGLPDIVPLLALNDLDNYLFPLVPKLTKGTGRQFASVWATKRHAARSSVAVCQTHTVQDPGGVYSLQVRTTASASTTAYKRQIRDQITAAQPFPMAVSPSSLRSWLGPAALAEPLEGHDRLARLNLGRDAGARRLDAPDSHGIARPRTALRHRPLRGQPGHHRDPSLHSRQASRPLTRRRCRRTTWARHSDQRSGRPMS